LDELVGWLQQPWYGVIGDCSIALAKLVVTAGQGVQAAAEAEAGRANMQPEQLESSFRAQEDAEQRQLAAHRPNLASVQATATCACILAHRLAAGQVPSAVGFGSEGQDGTPVGPSEPAVMGVEHVEAALAALLAYGKGSGSFNARNLSQLLGR